MRTEEIKYSYDCVPTVKTFSRSNAFIRGLLGPLGSGKSSGCAVELIRRARAQAPGPNGVRKSKWAVIRGTYPQLRDTTIRTVTQWLPPHLFGELRVSDNQYNITAFPDCEIEILFRALDRPDHISNLLSLELTGAWINESREVPWAILEALQGRVGRYPGKRDGGASWYGIWMDTNPPDSDSPWYKFFEERPLTEEGATENKTFLDKFGRPFAEIFRQPSGMAPEAENIPNLPNGRGYYETLVVGKDRAWIQVYVEGNYGFVVDGRPVFPEYNDGIHCTERAAVQRGEVIYRGWDFGLTPACVFAQLNSFGQLVVLDEVVSDNMGIDSFGDEVLDHCARNWSKGKLGWEPEFIDVGDPAGQQRAQTDERTCFQILASKGIFAEPGQQTLTIRLESLRKPLTTIRGKGKTGDVRYGFVMHPRCKVLRKGFMGGYQFRRLNTSKERYTEKPDKNEVSHPMDALEYVATVLFGEGLTTERTPQSRKGTDSALLEEMAAGADGRDPRTGY